MEVILVDNCSMDGTAEYVRVNFPDVRVRSLDVNSGYGRANNLGMRESSGKYIVILNPDTYLEHESLSRLVEPLEERDRTITVPKILLYDGSRINACGNIEHFTGLTFTRGLGKDPDSFGSSECVSGISGACFAMRRNEYLGLGGFDERFFVYMEDAELSWRAKANDFKFLYVPEAVVYHDYSLEVTPRKILSLEKGRYVILRKFLSRNELVLAFPSLLMTELLTTGYSGLKGKDGMKCKLNAAIEGLTSEVEKVDCDRTRLLRSLDWRIPDDQLTFNILDKGLRRMANAIYYLNYRVLTG